MFALSKLEIVAGTGYGENRGGGVPGMQSVINSGCNRLKHGGYGNDLVEIFLKRVTEDGRDIFQYDCWDPNDANYKLITDPDLDDIMFRAALELADKALDGTLEDITGGALNYYAASMKKPPKWACGKSPCAVIAGQLFFKDM